MAGVLRPNDLQITKAQVWLRKTEATQTCLIQQVRHLIYLRSLDRKLVLVSPLLMALPSFPQSFSTFLRHQTPNDSLFHIFVRPATTRTDHLNMKITSNEQYKPVDLFKIPERWCPLTRITRPYDLNIDLDPGNKMPFGPLYNLMEEELKKTVSFPCSLSFDVGLSTIAVLWFGDVGYVRRTGSLEPRLFYKESIFHCWSPSPLLTYPVFVTCLALVVLHFAQHSQAITSH
ncbi:hypothetical protein PROFUN_12526 [Planoprotostelium fungivorum]|uniref:Uncharacterized protein n=1 Tax=Planoprotostelium fungivorum TaxID=1890364 RepID=A0A2P6MS29_9EUKA|nr:hypothetical protein PROFUN_12526 [Planoprotostelium fungivorum]